MSSWTERLAKSKKSSWHDWLDELERMYGPNGTQRNPATKIVHKTVDYYDPPKKPDYQRHDLYWDREIEQIDAGFSSGSNRPFLGRSEGDPWN